MAVGLGGKLVDVGTAPGNEPQAEKLKAKIEVNKIRTQCERSHILQIIPTKTPHPFPISGQERAKGEGKDDLVMNLKDLVIHAARRHGRCGFFFFGNIGHQYISRQDH